MEFETSTLMMIFFIIILVVSLWKIYAFLPNKQLADDDKTKESQEELTNLILLVIKNNNGNLTINELFQQIKCSEIFDEKHYWRFNQNRLNQLLNSYYLKHPHVETIKDIYKNIT
ncbi:MAG: hypothetical protein L3J10_08265 [Sulfurimonas sp.]|nr:hypothetical protein [Sulfurimonas sp.]